MKSAYVSGYDAVSFMRCFRRKRLHLILALAEHSGVILLAQFRRKLVHVDSKPATVAGNHFALCEDAEDCHRWLVGGKDNEEGKGFIKSIRIVYK